MNKYFEIYLNFD